jgi:Tfp pilus assembly protein PilF
MKIASTHACPAAAVLVTCQLLCGCQLPLRTDTEVAAPVPATASGNAHDRGALSSGDSHRNQQQIAAAISLMHAGRLEEARAKLVEILTVNSSDSSAVELLAEVSQKLGDYRLQRASLKRLIELQPGSAPVANRTGKLLLNSIQLESLPGSPETIDASRQSINLLQGEAETENLSADAASTLAIAALQSAVDLEPRNTLFAQDLFAALIDLGKNAQAERVLQEALQRNPRDRILPMVAARLYESHEDWSTAEFYYDVALRNDPTNPVWRRHRAVCHFRQGSFEKAQADFCRSLAGSPVKPQLSEHLAWAEAAMKTEDHGEAQRVLNLIVEQGEYRTADIEVLRGTCLLQQGDIPAAADIVLRAQLDWPRHAGLWRLAKEIKAAESGTPVRETKGALDLAGLSF